MVGEVVQAQFSRAFDTVTIGGVEVAVISRAELATMMMEDALEARRKACQPKLIFDVNGHGLSLAYSNQSYRQTLNAADLIHADGSSIVIASRILTSRPLPERIATTDFFHDAAAVASKAGLTFFFLGATNDIAEECADRMSRLYPSLRIAGRRHGYFGISDEPSICDEINASGADVVWVGLGKPKEQEFCIRNRHRINAAWLITCGGCFNYVAGRYSRAPLWMQQAGIEWLHRVITNPRQFFWRYLTTNPHALWLIATRSETKAGSRGKRQKGSR